MCLNPSKACGQVEDSDLAWRARIITHPQTARMGTVMPLDIFRLVLREEILFGNSASGHSSKKPAPKSEVPCFREMQRHNSEGDF